MIIREDVHGFCIFGEKVSTVKMQSGLRNWSCFFSRRFLFRAFSSQTQRLPIVVSSNNYEELPIVHISATYNNTILTITDHAGTTLGWKSAGSEGFKNAKRGTNFAGQQAAIATAKKAIDLGIKNVRVKVKGLGPARKASVKGLELGGLNVFSVTDVTPVPHNGCRPRKARRL